MHLRIRQCCFLMFFVFIVFGFSNKSFAEPTTVTSNGIKFPDGTTQTTAWIASGSNVYYNKGNVGIGTASPLAPLYVHSSVTWPTVPIMTENNIENGTGAGIIMGKSRGTIDSKAIVSNGDNFGAIHFAGYDGLNYKVGASIFGEVDGTPTSGSVPGRIGFRTSDGTYDAYGLGKERMRIDSSGNVGIGTSSPTAKVHIKGSGTNNAKVKIDGIEGDHPTVNFMNNGIQIGVAGWFRNEDAMKFLYATTLASTNGITLKSDGSVGIGTASPSYPLEMASGAHVTTAGVWTNASSREYKENIRDLTYDEAQSTLSSLTPSKFNYKVDKDDEYLGFIAEDVPDLVATKDRKGLSPMDIVAVLTKVVQQQQEKIAEHQKENGVLNLKLTEVMSRLEALEK